MAIVSYEVHAREQTRWRIEGVFGDRQEAVERAKSLIGGPIVAIRVIEETLNPENNCAVDKIVYSDTTEQKVKPKVETFISKKSVQGTKAVSVSSNLCKNMMIYVAGVATGSLAMGLVHFL